MGFSQKDRERENKSGSYIRTYTHTHIYLMGNSLEIGLKYNTQQSTRPAGKTDYLRGYYRARAAAVRYYCRETRPQTSCHLTL